MGLAVLIAVVGAACGGAAVVYSWMDRPLPPAEPEPAAPPQPPTSGTVSLDGLVQHYLSTGVAVQRADDALPFDQPLAPEAPQPSAGTLSDLVARLPVIPRAEGPVGG